MTIPLQRLDIQEYQIDDLLDIPPVEISRDAEIVQCLATEAKAVTGTQPATKGAGPACNGWMFITNGIPAICGYGVQCGGVHGADEWVNLESLQQVTEVYARTILRFLQRGDRFETETSMDVYNRGQWEFDEEAQEFFTRTVGLGVFGTVETESLYDENQTIIWGELTACLSLYAPLCSIAKGSMPPNIRILYPSASKHIFSILWFQTLCVF